MDVSQHETVSIQSKINMVFNQSASQNDIVVADDEPAIAECIAEMLREEGYSVRVFHDGASALVAIEERRPLLALLDITMPVMSGDEVLEVLQQSRIDVPVIVMSAATRLVGFLERGAAAVIAKPFDIDQLLHCVDALIRYGSVPHKRAVGRR